MGERSRPVYAWTARGRPPYLGAPMSDVKLGRPTRVSPSPYRAPAEVHPPATFVFAPVNATAGKDGLMLLTLLFSFPLMMATVAGWIAGSEGAILGLVAGAAFGVRSWRARRRAVVTVLSVEDGLLLIAVGDRWSDHESIRLGELADAVLDVKTIQRVMDGDGPIPALRTVDSKLGPSVDTARIVLVDQSGREVRLGDDYLPHSEATTWLGKIRVFLRKQGWVPEDERPVDEVDADEA